MKGKICTVIGLAGGAVSSLFGGWNSAIAALLVCMTVDYATGLIVAGVFNSSPKSSGGGLESRVGWKGLIKKFVTLLIVLGGHQMDLVLGVEYIRDAVVIGFCAYECISILENAGLMGLPIPGVIRVAIDLLKSQSEAEEGT